MATIVVCMLCILFAITIPLDVHAMNGGCVDVDVNADVDVDVGDNVEMMIAVIMVMSF